MKISANLTEFEKGLKSAEKSLAATGSRFQSIGSKLTQGLTVPIVVVAGGAIKAAMDFETSFSGVGKTVDGVMTKSGKITEFGAKLAQGFRDMAKSMPVSVNELNKIGEAAGALGIPRDKILEFTGVMAKLGATTNLSSDQAATSIAQIQNIFGAAGQDTQKFADVLVQLGNNGASTEAQIVDFAQRLAGAGHQIGMSQTEILGFGNAMASLGMNAEAGGTAMSAVMSKMSVAVDTGNDKLGKFAAVAGMSSTAFAQLFKADAAEAINRVVEGFGRVKDSGGNLTTTLIDLGLKNSRVMDSMKLMAGGGALLRDSLNMAKDAAATGGALNEEYGKKAATTASQLQILYNKAYDVAITFGQQLLPSLINLVPVAESVLHGVALLVQGFAGLSTPVQEVAIGFVAFVAAIGPVTFAVGKVVSALSGIAGVSNVVLGFFGTAGTVTAASVGGVLALAAAFGVLAVKIAESIQQFGFMATLQQGLFAGGLQGALGPLGAIYGGGTQTRGRSPGTPKAPGAPGLFGGSTVASLLAGAKNVDDFAVYGTLAGKATAVAEKLTAEQKKAAKAAEDWAKENDKITGKAAIKDAEEWMKRLSQIGGVTKLSAKANEDLTKTLDSAMEAYKRLGPTAGVAGAAMLAVWAGQQKAAPVVLDQLSAATQKTIELTTWAKQLVSATVGRLGLPNDTGPQLILPKLPGVVSEMSLATLTINADAIAKSKLAVSPFREAFNQLGKDLPEIVFGALKNGGSIVGAVAAGIGAQFSKQFSAALEKAGGDLSKVSGQNKALGVAGASIGAAFTGFAMGEQFGKAKGALGGAASGAMAGAVAGPIGMGVGALVGGIAGFFGGKAKEKEAQKQLSDARAAWIEQYGGVEKLTAMADKLGVSLSNAFTTKKPEEFKKSVDALNLALEAQKTKLEGIGMIVGGAADRGKIFGESKTQSQEEFNRVGAITLGAVGANVANGGGILETLVALKPALDALNASQAQYNFTASETTQRLLEINAGVTANGPAFQALSADGQILNGMLKANWADMGLFAATSSDVAAQIAKITAGGMPMAQALGLNQPVLQSLWEAQQKFGFATDEATQALIDQAVQQGIVGPQMKDVNQKILDVLLAIGKVLGADIPNALANLPAAAANAANGMSSAFGGVTVPDIPGGPWSENTGVTGDYSGFMYHPGANTPVFNGNVPQLARGGIVRARPGGTLVNVGEGGRDEMVTPLDSDPMAPIYITLELDGAVVGGTVVDGIRKNRDNLYTRFQAALGNA